MEALIFENKVVDVKEVKFEVHSSMTWMDCSDDCIIGWTLEDVVLTAPPEPLALTYVENRRFEYPTVQELVVALYDEDAKAAIETKRAEIKAKYPKP